MCHPGGDVDLCSHFLFITCKNTIDTLLYLLCTCTIPLNSCFDDTFTDKAFCHMIIIQAVLLLVLCSEKNEKHFKIPKGSFLVILDYMHFGTEELVYLLVTHTFTSRKKCCVINDIIMSAILCTVFTGIPIACAQPCCIKLFAGFMWEICIDVEVWK